MVGVGGYGSWNEMSDFSSWVFPTSLVPHVSMREYLRQMGAQGFWRIRIFWLTLSLVGAWYNGWGWWVWFVERDEWLLQLSFSHFISPSCFNEGVSKANGGSRFLTHKDLLINAFPKLLRISGYPPPMPNPPKPGTMTLIEALYVSKKSCCILNTPFFQHLPRIYSPHQTRGSKIHTTLAPSCMWSTVDVGKRVDANLETPPRHRSGYPHSFDEWKDKQLLTKTLAWSWICIYNTENVCIYLYHKTIYDVDKYVHVYIYSQIHGSTIAILGEARNGATVRRMYDAFQSPIVDVLSSHPQKQHEQWNTAVSTRKMHRGCWWSFPFGRYLVELHPSEKHA